MPHLPKELRETEKEEERVALVATDELSLKEQSDNNWSLKKSGNRAVQTQLQWGELIITMMYCHRK